MKTAVVSFWVLACAAPVAGTPTDRPASFLCVADHSIGYALGSSGQWKPATFDVKKRKYVLKKSGMRWYWTESGEKADGSLDVCGEFNEMGFIKCDHSEVQVLFNRKSLRFQVVDPYGYVVADTALESANLR